MPDKLPLQSKKFAAFLIAEITWKIVILVCVVKLIHQSDEAYGIHTIMLTSVIIAGFIEAGYIGGQAWLDRYVKVAEITTGKDVAQSKPSSLDSTGQRE